MKFIRPKQNSFLLHCPIFDDKRHTLLSTLNYIDCKILMSTDSYLTQTLSYGCTSFDLETNTLVFNTTIDYMVIYWKIRRASSLVKNNVFQICSHCFSLILSQFPLVFCIYLFFMLIYYFDFFCLFVLLGTLDFHCLVVVIF